MVLFIHWRVVAEVSGAAFGWRWRFLFYAMTCGDGRGGGELGGQLCQPAGNDWPWGPALTISLTHSRARGADDGGRRRRDASYGVARDSHPVSTTAVRGPALTISLTHSRARGADDGGRRRRDASYGVARDSHPVSTTAVRGPSAACSLSDISGWRDGVLYPLAGGGRGIRRGAVWLRRRDAARPARADGEAAGGAVDSISDIPVRGDDGARAIGANEPRGRRRQHP